MFQSCKNELISKLLIIYLKQESYIPIASGKKAYLWLYISTNTMFNNFWKPIKHYYMTSFVNILNYYCREYT